MQPRFVTDTHAFLWYLTDNPTLSKKARVVFDESEKGNAIIIIPMIVLLESIDIVDKKKVNFEFEKILLKLTQASNFIVPSIDLGLVLEVNKIKGFKDLHDRIIVATADLFDAPLITKDKFIHRVYKNVLW